MERGWTAGRYFKALTESQYGGKRSRLVRNALFWWIRRASGKHGRTSVTAICCEQTQILAQKLSTAEILRRIRRLEEMRDHLGRTSRKRRDSRSAVLGASPFDFAHSVRLLNLDIVLHRGATYLRLHEI